MVIKFGHTRRNGNAEMVVTHAPAMMGYLPARKRHACQRSMVNIRTRKKE